MKTLLQRMGITRGYYLTPLQRALEWVKEHRIPNSGIVVHHKTKNVTSEVTGYLIASLYGAGEEKLAYDLARWEVTVQKKDGSFTPPGINVSYTFDTAQVIRGFLAVLDDMPHLEGHLRLACDYVDKNIDSKGKVLTVSYDMWKLSDGSRLTEYGNLYVLPAMLQAGIKLGEQKYIDAARRGMNYFREFPDLVEFKRNLSTFSHYFGYMMEALVDLGEKELALKGLKQVEDLQSSYGAIPAYPGSTWDCATGMAQLAVAWYKLGIKGPADKAVKYLEGIQNPSGGFYGGYGRDVEYFDKQEISWAVKFFIDACYWRDQSND